MLSVQRNLLYVFASASKSIILYSTHPFLLLYDICFSCLKNKINDIDVH